MIDVTIRDASFSTKEKIMSKSLDSKKAVKKEPAKTVKEKKADKKIKKEEKKRQWSWCGVGDSVSSGEEFRIFRGRFDIR